MLKKKIIPVFLASVLTVSGTTGFVTEAFSENVYAAEEVHTERLADFADLLDDGQEEELEAKLDQVSEDYGCCGCHRGDSGWCSSAGLCR